MEDGHGDDIGKTLDFMNDCCCVRHSTYTFVKSNSVITKTSAFKSAACSYLSWSSMHGGRSWPMTWSISSCNFCWMAGYLARSKSAHRSVVAVVSPPATNNSMTIVRSCLSVNVDSGFFSFFCCSIRKWSTKSRGSSSFKFSRCSFIKSCGEKVMQFVNFS